MSRNHFFWLQFMHLIFVFLKQNRPHQWIEDFSCVFFCFWWVFWPSKKKQTNSKNVEVCLAEAESPEFANSKTSNSKSSAHGDFPRPNGGHPTTDVSPPGGFGRPWRGQGMTHETAEQILVGHFDPRSNHRHSWLVAAGSNPAYEQFALQCPHPLEGWDGKLGEKICGL